MKILFWSASFLVVYTYLVYPGILWVFFRKSSLAVRRSSDLDWALPRVTILVSAYNEEAVIKEKIANCLLLDYPKDLLEIVIASDGSTDRTEEILAKSIEKGIRPVMFKERTGKVNVLNKLIKEAKGEIVVLTDANTILKTDAIKVLVNRFSDKKTGCVCGELNFIKGSGVENLESVYWRYEQFMKEIEGQMGALLGANGGIYALRKSLFSRIPENVIIDDFLIPMRILEQGYKVVYEPMAVAYEDASKKIVQELERRVRIGAGDFQALTLTWKMLNPLKGFSAFAYMSHKVVRWIVPFLMIVMFFANLVLVGDVFYRILFFAQVLFYLSAVTGRVLNSLHVSLKIFGLAHYFVSMNLGLFFGFLRFVNNSQSVMWKRNRD